MKYELTLGIYQTTSSLWPVKYKDLILICLFVQFHSNYFSFPNLKKNQEHSLARLENHFETSIY